MLPASYCACSRPNAPWPLTWHSVWRDIAAVPPGHWLDLDTAAYERWWTPPAPDLPLAEAGRLLRTALENAVDRGDHDLVACDLSGLDSSSLFGLAAQRGPVVGLTYEADDPGDEDVPYARHLAESVGAAHDVLPAADAPLPFQGLRDDAGPFDEPTWVSSYRARIGTTSARAAALGASLRFAGHGGDEVLMPPPVWLADIARRHPLRAARLARRVQAKYRLSAADIAGMVAARTTYPEWFAGCLDGRQPGEWQTMSWGIPPALPNWLTADAVDLVRTAIAGTTATALAADRGMHATLEVVHTGALAARHIAQLGAADGMPVALPYFDDRVLEACLAIRPEDAIDPARYKPQLVTAMTGVLPSRTLNRASKSEISMTVGRGWATHRSELMDLVDDSELARLGLIDAAAVRRICAGPYDAASCGPVRQILDLESWLRTATKGSG
ncbi:asparagine synthase-related protein [Kribbella sp. NPDC054772]